MTNPLLINAPARIYTLNTGSPAINAGVNLGNTYKSTLLPASAWPDGVSLQNQGSSWEIGAYLYTGGSGPPGGAVPQVGGFLVGP